MQRNRVVHSVGDAFARLDVHHVPWKLVPCVVWSYPGISGAAGEGGRAGERAFGCWV